MRGPVRVWDVGVVAVTWASFFPPTRPRDVLGNLGDTPRPPAERDRPSLHSPFPTGMPYGETGADHQGV